MKPKKKIILSVVVLIIVLFGTIGVSIMLSFKYQQERIIGEDIPPNYLTTDEIVIIESAFCIKLPPTTQKIKVHLNRNGFIYCYVLFKKEDLEEFKSSRLWLAGNKAAEIMETQIIPPYHSVWAKFYYDLQPVEWWNVDKSRVQWASKESLDSDNDSNVDITIELDSNELVHCYLILLASEKNLEEIKKLFSGQPGWDIRESGLPVPLVNRFSTLSK